MKGKFRSEWPGGFREGDRVSGQGVPDGGVVVGIEKGDATKMPTGTVPVMSHRTGEKIICVPSRHLMRRVLN